jgi:hypothetical protein
MDTIFVEPYIKELSSLDIQESENAHITHYMSLFLYINHLNLSKNNYINFDILNYKKTDWGLPKYKSFKFFPLSCECGTPECNEFYSGVNIIFSPQKIKWIINPLEKKQLFIFKNDVFEFDRNQYEDCMQNCLNKINDLSKNISPQNIQIGEMTTLTYLQSFVK